MRPIPSCGHPCRFSPQPMQGSVCCYLMLGSGWFITLYAVTTFLIHHCNSDLAWLDSDLEVSKLPFVLLRARDSSFSGVGNKGPHAVSLPMTLATSLIDGDGHGNNSVQTLCKPVAFSLVSCSVIVTEYITNPRIARTWVGMKKKLLRKYN